MLQDTSVLIVEDELLVAELLENMLRSLGYNNIQRASEVAQALAMISAFKPDFAIVDMNLRGKTAHAVAQKLQNENVSFIVSTGYAAVEFEWQDCPRITKPYGPDELANAIRQVLNRKKSAGNL